MSKEKHKHDTRVALRRAIAVHGVGANQTRLAAIEFCHARNIDPHWRHAVYPKFEPDFTDWSKPADIDVYSVTQWQQVVERFAKEDA